MQNILEKAKKSLFDLVNEFGSDPYNLDIHIREMEKWAHYMLNKYPDANKEVVLLAVWLHDIGHYPTDTDIDHAIRSEERARKFLLSEEYPSERLKEVLHCVRAHRCSDVMPMTLEAKIIAFIDSASHMTDYVYFRMAQHDKENKQEFRAYGKMERDLRDLSSFPEIREEVLGLYNAWENLIKQYEKIDI